MLLWTKKIGYFQLEVEKETVDDWIIILDESIEFGHDKLLVVYGIPDHKVNYNKPLGYEDLTTLSIISGDKWTGELIKNELEKIIIQRGKIIYAVADGGNAIRKGLRLAGIPHVYDITHKFAWMLKEIYKNEKEFQSYTTGMAKMRGKFSLTNISHILPPNQRFHSRFMNLDIISDWGMKVLNYLQNGKKTDRTFKVLKWVKDYHSFIEELHEVNLVLNKIKALLKVNSLSIKNARCAKKLLLDIKIKNDRTDRLKSFIIEFLNELTSQLNGRKKLLCTSDIIESAFGKYKNYISNNPMVGITNLALCMAAFTSKLDKYAIKEALENVKVDYLRTWSISNIGSTNLQRRKAILKKIG